MNLFLVKRTDAIGWDENCAAVVRAESAQQAREMMAAIAADERPDVWLAESTVVEDIKPASEPEILLVSFNAG